MLDFNDITHDKVTLESGNEIIKRSERPEISLNKSKYSFKGMYIKEKQIGPKPFDLLRGLINDRMNFIVIPELKEPIRDFYTHKKSCSTFCMNFLLNSGAFDPMSNLYREIMKMVQIVGKNLSDGILEVSHFKKIIFKIITYLEILKNT